MAKKAESEQFRVYYDAAVVFIDSPNSPECAFHSSVLYNAIGLETRSHPEYKEGLIKKLMKEHHLYPAGAIMPNDGYLTPDGYYLESQENESI